MITEHKIFIFWLDHKLGGEMQVEARREKFHNQVVDIHYFYRNFKVETWHYELH